MTVRGAGSPVRPEPARGPATTGAVDCRLHCLSCGHDVAFSSRLRCPGCSGALEPRWPISLVRSRTHPDPAHAYLDFLPLDSVELLVPGVMRRTPCHPLPALGAAIGVPRLWAKDESQQPSGSTKDRMAALVLAMFRRFGVTEFVAASTGNSSTALVRAVRLGTGLRAHLFCGRAFVRHQGFEADDVATLHVVDGDYAAASAAARRFAAERQLPWEGGFFNWGRREGLKLAYLEAFDDLGFVPDVVVQAVSSGMGIIAAEKAAREYREAGLGARDPRFLIVQQDTCAPMVSAWRAGRSRMAPQDVVADPSGLAAAILLGDATETYPYLAATATRTKGDIVSVSQTELVRSRRMLFDLEGIRASYSSAATIAAVINAALREDIDPAESVLVNLTGGRECADS